MKRRTFDRIVSFVGLGLSVFLFVAAALLNWGASFANDSVATQLSQQKITMPDKESAGFKALSEEAQAGAALAASAKSKADPANTALATEAATLMGQRTSLFMGETLRGLLLYSFAFWQIGQIAMYAAWAAAAGGLLMLILTLLGFAHLRRVEADATI
ncbi:MAG: hypothetical protein EBW09_02110 [Actinobacteria bacterium]|nr:hypothetical protein [Actinomycetota bacterium]